jgi:hypothetical protein
LSEALNRPPPRRIVRLCFSRTSTPRRQPFRIHLCNYVSQCKAHRCLKRATRIAEKTDVAGRHVRQIELCALHCEIVIERERSHGLEISDRRDE